jgi:hypothetical protein
LWLCRSALPQRIAASYARQFGVAQVPGIRKQTAVAKSTAWTTERAADQGQGPPAMSLRRPCQGYYRGHAGLVSCTSSCEERQSQKICCLRHAGQAIEEQSTATAEAMKKLLIKMGRKMRRTSPCTCAEQQQSQFSRLFGTILILAACCMACTSRYLTMWCQERQTVTQRHRFTRRSS